MSKKISQRDARQTRKELSDLKQKMERMFESFRSDWPGVHIGGQSPTHEAVMARIKTARTLGFAVIVVPADGDRINFYAGKP
jgi:hypothetical protein